MKKSVSDTVYTSIESIQYELYREKQIKNEEVGCQYIVGLLYV